MGALPQMLPDVLFHGTSSCYLDAIVREGLRPESSCTGYLCFTDDPAIAAHHARHMADWDGARNGLSCEPLIFSIPSNLFRSSQFCLDENFIRLGPSAGRGTGKDVGELIEQRRKSGYRWSWQELLSIAGSVGYRGVVSVRLGMVRRLSSQEPLRTDQVRISRF